MVFTVIALVVVGTFKDFTRDSQITSLSLPLSKRAKTSLVTRVRIFFTLTTTTGRITSSSAATARASIAASQDERTALGSAAVCGCVGAALLCAPIRGWG